MRRLAAVVVAAMLSGCAAPDSGTSSSSCVDEVLAAYRSLATPATDAAKGYGSILRSAASGAERVESALREARAAANDYGDAKRDAARVADACSGDDAVDDPCRAAVELLAGLLRDTGDLPSLPEDGIRAAAVARRVDALENERVRLEGAAAATAACSPGG